MSGGVEGLRGATPLSPIQSIKSPKVAFPKDIGMISIFLGFLQKNHPRRQLAGGKLYFLIGEHWGSLPCEQLLILSPKAPEIF
jgi:hypothetical protein